MKKTLPFVLTFAAGFILALLLFKGCGDRPKSNETDNIGTAVDTAKIIQQGQAPYIAQISEKETIIANLTKTVTELEAMKAKGNALAGNLAERLKRAESDLAKERGELTRLTVLLSETRFNATAQLEEKEREGVGMEIGEDLPPLYVAKAAEPNGWFFISALIDTYADTVSFDTVLVRNDFEKQDFIAADGTSKFRVVNRNPYTFTLPGTNVFDLKPVTAPIEKKHRFGFGLTAGAFAIKDFTGKDINVGYGGGLAFFYRIL